MDRVEKMLGRMKASKLYRCVDWDPEGKAKDLVDKFNSASRSETMTRTGEYLGKLFAHMGKECYIEPPFYCDYGTNIHVGDYFYANTGLIFFLSIRILDLVRHNTLLYCFITKSS